MRIRKYLKLGKPCVKGSIMVLLGIFNSRKGIGVEIFTLNLIYGPLAYLFLGLSGIMIIKLLQISENHSYNGKFSKKSAQITSIILYIIGLILIVVNIIENTMIYSFNVVILLFSITFGILWCFLGYFVPKSQLKVKYINIIYVSLIFSIGLIYGVFLNTFILQIYIFFFFLSSFFLQSSRELMKDFKINDINVDFIGLDSRVHKEKILKVSLIFQLLAIVFYILPFYTNISSSVLIIVLMIFGIFFISLAGILTLKSILENTVSNKTSSILKIGILIELLALLVIGN